VGETAAVVHLSSARVNDLCCCAAQEKKKEEKLMNKYEKKGDVEAGSCSSSQMARGVITELERK
jgi:hypothetical protein